MSQVTRYTTKLLQSDKTGRLEICPCYEGEWIAYSDYASLAADKDIEIKVLNDEVDCVREENAALAAENERLSRMFAELETPYLSNNLIDSAYAEKLKSLAAENERLLSDKHNQHAEHHHIEAGLEAKIEQLTAENERLRKAGDAMYGYITNVILDGRISSPYLNKLQDDWDNAAKEGRDAK